jgi:hypothetical protein
MSKQDQWITIVVICCIVIHLLLWIVGYLTNRLAVCTALVNTATGLTVLIYWIQKAVRVQLFITEPREVIVLIVELGVIAGGMLTVSNVSENNWLRFFNYLAFGIHLLALLFFLFFMLTFKIKRLI